MPPLKKVARWPWALFVLAAVGCGSNNPVYPVRGKVTFAGKPMVGGGAISLLPMKGESGKTAGGIIAEDGSYALSTYGDGDGSMLGEFRVVIFQQTDKEPEATPDGQRRALPATVVPAADRIPAVYSDPSNSPLRATVEARSQEINFDLKRT